LLIACCLQAQTMKDAITLFERHEFDSAIAISKRYLQTDPGAYQIAGQALVQEGKYSEAIPYLQKGSSIADAPASVRAWCMHDLGIASFMQGDYVKAKDNLDACIALAATRNSVKSASGAEALFGLSNLYDGWTRKETRHFVFHFQHWDDSKDLYIAATEAAYDSINRFFRARMPKKIDYFVWEDAGMAMKLFHRELAFTKAAFCLTHTTIQHTRGHEIAHSISTHAAVITQPNKLIIEGLASYFDFSGRNWDKELAHNIPRISPGPGYSVVNVWKTGDAPDKVLYPMGAALTGRLIERFGRDKFLQLLADGSYENARRIYGNQLDQVIAEINKITDSGY
jgi:tetratricopeptide (TPR) repeat protein